MSGLLTSTLGQTIGGTLRGIADKGVDGFSPASLFAAGEYGAWYDPSDISTLSQDSAGTTPITATGQPYGRQADLSGNGNHATAADAVRPAYVPGGFDTTGSKYLSCNALAAIFSGTTKPWSVHFSCKQKAAGGTTAIGVGSSTNATPYQWLQFTRGSDFASIVAGRSDTNAAITSAASRIGNNISTVVSFICNGSTVDMWINGTLAKSGVAVQSLQKTLDTFAFGALVRTSAGSFGAAVFGGSIIINRVTTAEETRNIHRYLGARFGVVSAPAVTTDVLIVAGQSNAQGRGTSGPVVSQVAYEMDGAATKTLVDPVGGAITGSAWPAFANQWGALTDRSLAVVGRAVGGSALLAAANSATNWSSTGALRAALLTCANDTIAALQAKGSLGNVYLIWQQGEQDASAYNGTTVTDALYQTAQEELFAYFFANITGLGAIFVSELGAHVPTDTNYDLIRAAQDAAVAATDNVYLAYAGAKAYPGQGKMQGDGVHYTQAGLDDMGTGLATGAAAVIYP